MILNETPFIFCSNIKDGNMSGRFGDEAIVKQNIDSFFGKLNIRKQDTLRLHLTNDNHLTDLERKLKCDSIKTDAIVTKLTDYYFYLGFADCIPMVAYDDKNNILGFAHLGWKNICGRLQKKVLDLMVNKYNSNIDNIKVFFGPSILKESYAFPQPAQLEMPEWEKYIFKKDDLYHIDLQKYIIDDLISLGVKESNICENTINTATDKRFYSHFRSQHNMEEMEGRFIFGTSINL